MTDTPTGGLCRAGTPSGPGAIFHCTLPTGHDGWHQDGHGAWEPDPPRRRWDPSENCYCGGPEEIYPHRHGTGYYCRREVEKKETAR